MNSGPILFLSALATLAASFWGLIVVPQVQLGLLDLRPLPPSDRPYPATRVGWAKEGADIYRAHGCVECHTQQVRPAGYGADMERGWGVRRTVAQDYLLDKPVLLGTLRMGPDLANVGVRQPSLEWHLKHLYNPRTVVEGSTMPRYAFLFEERRINGAPSPDALTLEGEFAAPEGYEVVPSDEAKALAAYLVSLQADPPLFEAPLPLEETDEGSTNAPPAEVAAPAGEAAAPAPETATP